MDITADDIDLTIIHETMRYNQLAKPYLALDKTKQENWELQLLNKQYKQQMVYYKKYHDAVSNLLLGTIDINKFIEWCNITTLTSL